MHAPYPQPILLPNPHEWSPYLQRLHTSLRKKSSALFPLPFCHCFPHPSIYPSLITFLSMISHIRNNSYALFATLTSALLLGGLQHIHAATYYFSFDDTAVHSSSVPGTVRGTITLPDGDGTHYPTTIVITEYPLALAPPDLEIIPTSWQTAAGSFQVTNGQITDASFLATTQDLFGIFSLNYANGTNSFTLDQATTIVSNRDGFAEVTSSSSPIPEPSAAILGALGTLALLRRKRI